ncbi:MAG: hypothetical protein LBC76_04700 [Treponema sp.]|jgi:hypothetical protein|nr:hypothetical protein [Treponema sp.]
MGKEKTTAKIKYLPGILAIALILGIMTAGCSKGKSRSNTKTSDGGTFTLTGIPSEYNGKYAMIDIMSAGGVDLIFGCQAFDTSKNKFTLSGISNEKVSIPMWTWLGAMSKGFSGNKTCDIEVSISDSSETGKGFDVLARKDFKAVKFSDGNAKKAWKDGE